ncbi:MAG: PKD domain-containing protein [Pirellulales bacterium]
MAQNGAVVDAGQDGPGVDFTGLGISTGGNDFSSYVAAASTANGAIVNLNADAVAGSQGPPADLLARNNVFFSSDPGDIDSVVYHDADDVNVAFVDFVAFEVTTLDLDAGTIDEGDAVELTGTFTNAAVAHTVTISWGDGSPDAVLNLTAGDFDFTAMHTYADDEDGPINSTVYTINVTVEEVLSSNSAMDSTSVTVNNVAPTIALSGAATHDESAVTSYSLTLGAVTDPGDDTVSQYIVFWGDGTSDVYGSAGVKTHVYDDDAAYAAPISVTLVDEDGIHASAGTFNLVVNNVAPTGTAINGGPINEGSSAPVVVVAQSDPSNADTLAGFTYDYDFNNNGTIEVGLGEIANSSMPSASVPGTFLSDDPDHEVRIVIRDKDGGETELFTTITINNVAPVVNAGPDTMAFSGILFTQSISFTDPGADAPWTVRIDWDGDSVFDEVTATGSHTFDVMHTYGVPDIGQTYTVTVEVDDNDGGVNSDTFDVTIVEDTFRVVGVTTNGSGVDIEFNRSPDLDDLNLYDGDDVAVELPDVTLVGDVFGDVAGSMVYDSSTNVLSFVATGGVLPDDNYTLTLTSAADAFNDLSGSLLDGDSDFTPGGDYVEVINVANGAARVVSLGDFARGAGQAIDLTPANLADDAMPIRIDDATGVTAVDLDLVFDPDLLTINSVALATGLPVDWSITQNPISPGLIKLTASGTTPLSGSNLAIYNLDAEVPTTAPYGASQVIRLENLRVNEDLTPSVADLAVHKAIYLGDASGNMGYSAFDASFISRVVVGLDSGFDEHDWTDPVIVGDATGDHSLSGLDASYVAQKAVLLPRPEIPDLPMGVVPIPAVGPDPLLTIPHLYGMPGGTVNAPVSIDDADGLRAVDLTLDYDTALLDLSNVDVSLTGLTSSGWSLVVNVDDGTGHVIIGAYSALALGPGGGDLLNFEFHVPVLVTTGVSPLDIDTSASQLNEGNLSLSDADGSITIDTTAPTVEAVKLSSQSWSPVFRGAIDPVDGVGYSIPSGPNQLAPVAWSNIDEINIQFSEDVDVEIGDLALYGINLPDYTGDIVDFSYNSGTSTATWTLSTPITVDMLTIVLDDALTDLAGNALDGEWMDTVSNFPSGDTTAGGDFEFGFAVLPGDADGNGLVDGLDYLDWASDYNQSAPPASPADFNGDAIVDGLDYLIWASHYNESLGVVAVAPQSSTFATAELQSARASDAVFADIGDEDEVGESHRGTDDWSVTAMVVARKPNSASSHDEVFAKR